jgi:hypothetical protein
VRFLLLDLCQLTLYEVYRLLLFISPSEEAQKLALLLPQFGERTLESVFISEQSLVSPPCRWRSSSAAMSEGSRKRIHTCSQVHCSRAAAGARLEPHGPLGVSREVQR